MKLETHEHPNMLRADTRDGLDLQPSLATPEIRQDDTPAGFKDPLDAILMLPSPHRHIPARRGMSLR